MRAALLLLWLGVLTHCSAAQHVRAPWPDQAPMRVQAGSDNLLPPLADGLRGWGPEGATLEMQQGQPAIRLGRGCRFTVGATTSPSTLYVLRYEYRLSSDLVVPDDPTKTALEGWFTPRDNKQGAVPIGGTDERFDGWHPVERRLFTPESNERVTVSLAFQGSAGCAWVRNVSVSEETVPDTDRRNVLRSGDRLWGEVTPSPGPRLELHQPLLFARSDPDTLTHGAMPRADEMGVPLDVVGCSGEVVVAGVGFVEWDLFTTARLRHLAVSDLSSASGTIASSAGTARRIAYWPRRYDYYGRGNTLCWAADDYEPPHAGFLTGRYHAYGSLVRIRIPDDAQPGTYTGTLSVDGGAATLPVHLTVRPFRLAEPTGTSWALYSDFGRWREMTDEQVLRELRDLREHGITALTVPCRGKATWADGRLTGWAWDKDALRGMGLIRQAGIPGPFLLQLEKEIDDLAADLGVPEGPPSGWPASLAVATEDLLRAIVADYAARGWGEPVFVGVDEPGYWKSGSPERFAWQYERATNAGMASYCTSSYLPSDPLGRNLTYHCYGGWLGSRERARARVEQARQAGQHPWYYAAGCYPGQIGNQVRNRYAAGFVFYASGVDGQAFWTLQRPRGNAFDDFSGETGQPCITLPDPDHPGESLDTPQWEGIRQAWYDYRYALTLERAVAAAQARGEGVATLAGPAGLLRQLRENLPWSWDAVDSGEVTCASLDALRSEIARAIEALQGNAR